jgi:methylmalonyl-CoA/ethylmalonyl-CoA epimerase
MRMSLDHIGIALDDFSQVEKILKLLGWEAQEMEEIPEQKVKVLPFLCEDNQIELLTPMSTNSPIAKFLETKGSGIHHLAFKVENIEEMIDNLKSTGIRMIDEIPRIGAGGKKIAFIHPKSSGGILIELVSEK